MNPRQQTNKVQIALLAILAACSSLALVVAPTYAQEPATQQLDCFIPHAERGYATWVCEPWGKVYSDRFTIYSVRTNQTGARVLWPIWKGPAEDWLTNAAQIIAEHKQAIAHCSVYFHVAHTAWREWGSHSAIQWNRVTRNMLNWWERNGQKKFPTLCYCSEPWAADFVMVWGDWDESVPYSYSVPVPETYYVGGTISGWVSNQPFQAEYWGYATTMRMRTYEGSWNIWNFLLDVRPVEERDDGRGLHLGTSVFWSHHKGRWRWSKPDKDSLIDALKAIESLGKVK